MFNSLIPFLTAFFQFATEMVRLANRHPEVADLLRRLVE